MALIEATDVEFGSGFNVITGETEAGKSVLLSTISLLLGARADKGLIRTGQQDVKLPRKSNCGILKRLLRCLMMPLLCSI